MHIFAYLPAIAMLLLILMPMGIAGLATTELALTSKRLIGRVRKHQLTIPFKDIESIRVRRSPLGLVFNYGSITIIGNGVRVKFPGITKPVEMKTLIDSAVENELFGDAIKTIPEAPPTPLPKPKAIPQTTPPEPEPKPEPKKLPTPTNPDAPAPTYKDPNAW